MKFYDRARELRLLEDIYGRKGADFLVISGRRRIGKSRLIDEFIKNKKSLNILIVPKEERQVTKDIEDEIRNKSGYSPSFDSVKSALEYMFEKDMELICLDEFSNVLEVNRAIPYELQRLWDKYKEEKDVLLIVSGSYVGMMNKLFAAKKAPLFNRATNTLSLAPLPLGTVIEILGDMGVSNPQEQIGYFCILGGVPYYYLLLEKQVKKGMEHGINALFFDPGAQLKEEGENVLKQEFGNAYSKYYAILESIHSGHASMKEISQKLGIRSATLMKYMKSLQHDFKIIERTVPFGENLVKSKKGRYLITDNTLAFWFSLVYGRRHAPAREELNMFISRRFELLCRNFLVSLLENRGERVLKEGQWWGQMDAGGGVFEQRELDLVVETDKALYIGECKWSEGRVGERELERLRESSGMLKTKKPIRLVLFTKFGCDAKETQDTLLFDSGDIVKSSGA